MHVSWRRPGLLLVIGLLCIYNANLRQVSSNDTYASRFLPISILRDGDLILDEFVPESIKREAGDDFVSYYFAYVDGHFYDSHPPVGPLLALPVYALPSWLGFPRRAELIANICSKLAASLMAALSALALFSASRRILRATAASPGSAAHATDRDARSALLGVLAYGLGTSIWSTASLAMWTHTPAVLGYAVALWALTVGRTGLAGAAAAVAVIARPATAPAIVLLAAYVVHRSLAGANWGRVIRFGCAAAAVGLSGMAYTYRIFGNLAGGAPIRMQYWYDELGTTSAFSGSLAAGLSGLTVSPGRGILIYSPIVVVAVMGAVRMWRSALNPETSDSTFGRADAILLLRYSSLAAIAILLTYSKYIVWWGGHGFGPRYLTDAMPFLGVLFAAGFATLSGRTLRLRVARVGVAVLFSYSIFIQALGAFCWPSPWTLNNHESPYRFRLWDWRGGEIEMCIRAGPRVDPATQALFRRLGL